MSETPIQGPAFQAGIRDALPVAPGEARGACHHDSLAFRRLLESLEQIGKGGQPAPESLDAATLPAALQTAEDDFGIAMELRRRLESAFRARNA